MFDSDQIAAKEVVKLLLPILDSMPDSAVKELPLLEDKILDAFKTIRADERQLCCEDVCEMCCNYEEYESAVQRTSKPWLWEHRIINKETGEDEYYACDASQIHLRNKAMGQIDTDALLKELEEAEVAKKFKEAAKDALS